MGSASLDGDPWPACGHTEPRPACGFAPSVSAPVHPQLNAWAWPSPGACALPWCASMSGTPGRFWDPWPVQGPSWQRPGPLPGNRGSRAQDGVPASPGPAPFPVKPRLSGALGTEVPLGSLATGRGGCGGLTPSSLTVVLFSGPACLLAPCPLLHEAACAAPVLPALWSSWSTVRPAPAPCGRDGLWLRTCRPGRFPEMLDWGCSRVHARPAHRTTGQ